MTRPRSSTAVLARGLRCLAIPALNSPRKGGGLIGIFKRKGKVFENDSEGFLLDKRKWAPELAEILAMDVGIHGGSAKEQRDAIHFIRREVEKTGRCPSLFEAGEAGNIDLDEKKRSSRTATTRVP